MTELSRRLTLAIANAGFGKRAFAKAMAARVDRGSTYRTLIKYLNGDTEPSLQYLEEAAQLLGVRLGWLAFGQGPMGEAEAMGEGPGHDDRLSRLKEALEAEPLYQALESRFDLRMALAGLAADLHLQDLDPDSLRRGVAGLGIALTSLQRWLRPAAPDTDSAPLEVSERFLEASLLAARLAVPSAEERAADDHAITREILETLVSLTDPLGGVAGLVPDSQEGIAWAGPFCTSSDHPDPLPMQERGGVLCCPACGHSAELPEEEQGKG